MENIEINVCGWLDGLLELAYCSTVVLNKPFMLEIPRLWPHRKMTYQWAEGTAAPGAYIKNPCHLGRRINSFNVRQANTLSPHIVNCSH